jgi:hypothetical protein
MRFASRLALLDVMASAPLTVITAQHGATSASIPQVAKTAGQFTTLLAAVDAADRTTGTSGSAIELIDLAIRRGVPLFNNGQPDATVALHEVATTAPLSLGSAVPSEA